MILSVEMLASILLLERRMQVLALAISSLQVKNFCVYKDLSNTLHESMKCLHVCDEVWVSF